MSGDHRVVMWVPQFFIWCSVLGVLYRWHMLVNNEVVLWILWFSVSQYACQGTSLWFLFTPHSCWQPAASVCEWISVWLMCMCLCGNKREGMDVCWEFCVVWQVCACLCVYVLSSVSVVFALLYACGRLHVWICVTHTRLVVLLQVMKSFQKREMFHNNNKNPQ